MNEYINQAMKQIRPRNRFAIGLAIMFIMFLGFQKDGLNRRERHISLIQSECRQMEPFQVRAMDGEPKPDQPGMAAFQDFIETMDPATGTVPGDRLRKALQELRQKTRLNKSGNVVSLVWEELPSNLGGRTRTLIFDPYDPAGRKVWAGAVTGGIWYNDDIFNASSSWKPVDDFLDNLSVSCIVFDTNNPDVMYAGTGEGQTAVIIYRESSGVGNGILKSVDGGNTWSWTNGGFAYVNDIVIRDENGQSVLYVAAVSGVYKGANHESSPSDGLFRSVNGGDSWEQVLPDIPGKGVPYAPSDIALGASGRLYVGTQRNLNGEGASVILWSDDGANWTAYTAIRSQILAETDPEKKIPGRVVLATAPSDSNVVYAVYASGSYNKDNFLLMSAYTIIKSTDKGETWQKTNMPSSGGGWAYLAWHALALEVDPNNPNTIYAGGLDQHKSFDSGVTWYYLSDWRGRSPDKYVHADQHKVVYKPGSSDTILFCTDGGFFLTTEGTEVYPKFQERNKDFNTFQLYTCDIHPDAGREYYITGAQDNSTYRYMGVPLDHRHFILGGDGAYCFFDKDEPDFILASYQYNRFYVFRNFSGDQLMEWTSASQYSGGIFINPADYDSRNNTLYANATTFDLKRKDQILRIKQMLTLPFGEYISLGTGAQLPFSCIKYSMNSPGDNTVVFAGTQSGRLFKIEHAESSPVVTEIGSPQFPPGNISSISVSYSDDEILVSFSNYGVTSVWRTLDGGTSWKNVEGDLPDMPVRWIMHHPYIKESAIIATELGVWKTENLDSINVTWIPNNDGLANVRIDMLRHRPVDNTIIAATHGRGLFVNRGIGLGAHGLIENAGIELLAYPNPNDGRFRVRLTEVGIFRIVISSMAGETIDIVEGRLSGREDGIEIDLSDTPAGVYLIRATCNKKSFQGKVIVQ